MTKCIVCLDALRQCSALALDYRGLYIKKFSASGLGLPIRLRQAEHISTLLGLCKALLLQDRSYTVKYTLASWSIRDLLR